MEEGEEQQGEEGRRREEGERREEGKTLFRGASPLCQAQYGSGRGRRKAGLPERGHWASKFRSRTQRAHGSRPLLAGGGGAGRRIGRGTQTWEGVWGEEGRRRRRKTRARARVVSA